MWLQGAEGPEISFDDFVEYVLPRDFENLKELQKVFYDKVNLNAGALQEVRHTALIIRVLIVCRRKSIPCFRQVFRRIDVDKGGTITTDELIHELNRMNIQIAPELAEAFSREFDEDGDAEIDFVEFSRAIRNMDPDRADKGATPTTSRRTRHAAVLFAVFWPVFL